jgi:hypothetical protein
MVQSWGRTDKKVRKEREENSEWKFPLFSNFEFYIILILISDTYIPKHYLSMIAHRRMVDTFELISIQVVWYFVWNCNCNWVIDNILVNNRGKCLSLWISKLYAVGFVTVTLSNWFLVLLIILISSNLELMVSFNTFAGISESWRILIAISSSTTMVVGPEYNLECEVACMPNMVTRAINRKQNTEFKRNLVMI